MFETFEANLVSEKGGQYFPPPHSPTHPPDQPSVTCSEKLSKPCRKCPRIADPVRDEHLTLSSTFWRLFCHESHRSVSQLTPNNPHDWFSISTTTFPAHATFTQYWDNAEPAPTTITPTLGDFFAVCATLESCVSAPSLTRSTSPVSQPRGATISFSLLSMRIENCCNSPHEASNQRRPDVGAASKPRHYPGTVRCFPAASLFRHYCGVGHGFAAAIALWGATCYVCPPITASLLCVSCPADTKHLYNICTMSAQRLRRWSNIIHMLYKCFAVLVLVLPLMAYLCNHCMRPVFCRSSNSVVAYFISVYRPIVTVRFFGPV